MSFEAGAFFAADGPLANILSGYSPRAAQQTMSEQVAAVLQDDGQLLVEAATGTGKTVAYLAPALALGRKTIVATATRHLQEQIYAKDVPLVQSALNRTLRVSLLKGRANYLCLHRLTLTEDAGDLRSPRLHQQLRDIRQWSGRTRSGDLSEVGDVADGSPIWPRVSSTTDNCLGTRCPEYENCWVVEARRRAQAADLVIANHHLLFADMALREEGFGEVLPGADAVILDEAHKLPEIAGRFFGQSVSGRQLLDLVSDGHAEALEAGGDMPSLSAALESLAAAEDAFNRALGDRPSDRAWPSLLQEPAVASTTGQLTQALAQLCQTLQPLAERSEGLTALGRRGEDIQARFKLLQTQDDSHVRWLERRGKGWVLHATPLDVSEPFTRALTAHKGAWIFTSATLSVNHSLDYFAGRLGLVDAQRLILESPFDYRQNSLLYLPADMPAPNQPGFDAAVIAAAAPLIKASGGGVFMLCTSHRAVRYYASALAAQGVGPLLVQGEAGRAALLDRFRSDGNAVLVGTSSFWEGVDVRGRGLRLVIIDRLPFASPADPVLAARMQAMNERGEQPFTQYQIPQAAIALKQGVGRLIRDAEDRGLLAICDPRLHSRGYGRIFLGSLPDMPVTRDRQDATDFLRQLIPA